MFDNPLYYKTCLNFLWYRALYIDNSELKTMRPFIMIGKIAKFLKECPHVDVECDRAISFLLGKILQFSVMFRL